MNETTAPTIMTDPSQSAETVNILNDILQLESYLENMPDVDTAEQAEVVTEYRAQLRRRVKDLNEERLTMTKPIRELTTTLNQKYNVHIERAERAAKLCDNLLMPYMRELQRQREEAERAERERREEEERAAREKAEAEAEAERIAKDEKDAEALKEAEQKVEEARAGLDAVRSRPAGQSVAKSVKGAMGSTTGLRKVWRYKVVDISKVPEEFLVDPEDRVRRGDLNKIAKRDQQDAHVPGIEFYYEESLSSTVASQA